VKLSPETRRKLRETYEEMQEATARAERVTRPDGVDGHGHPGMQALNLSSYLGGFVKALLEDIEELESGVNEQSAWLPYRVEWQADLSTRWSLMTEAESRGEAEAAAERILNVHNGRVRVVGQRVVTIRGLGIDKTELTL
jgi:hypothetical protein